MYVKLPLEDLNPSPYLPHSTSTYTYAVTIAPRMCGGSAGSRPRPKTPQQIKNFLTKKRPHLLSKRYKIL